MTGSSAMPQFGQFPGASRTISGCIGHENVVPAGKTSGRSRAPWWRPPERRPGRTREWPGRTGRAVSRPKASRAAVIGHCDRLMTSYGTAAVEYRALAAEHRRLAPSGTQYVLRTKGAAAPVTATPCALGHSSAVAAT